jgi:TolB protein
MMAALRRCARLGLMLLAVLAAAALASAPAAAELKIDITRGTVEPLPIAIVPFEGATEAQTRLGADIVQVIANDLENSGLFRLIPPASFPRAPLAVDAPPPFGEWRQINAPALVNGRVGAAEDGRAKIEFRLWDIYAEQQLIGLVYFTAGNNWRRIAHIIADAIYKRLTGEDGYFDTLIAYVAESGPQDRRVKRLAIMDQDGFNHRYLTHGSDLVLTPRFAPTMQEIASVVFVGGVPRIMLRNLESGRETLLTQFPGMSFAPRFSPDGLRLLFSGAVDGNTDIFVADLRSGGVQRLTSSAAIDTSPSYAPDGRQIVFNSDRGGSQQLYVMDAGGGNVRRISQGAGRYGTPVWSPRGDLIAFTKLMGGSFAIGVLAPDGSGERLLAEGFHMEGPAWAPNGRALVYFRKEPVEASGLGGRSRLFVVDLISRTSREVATPGDASDPTWSPVQP